MKLTDKILHGAELLAEEHFCLEPSEEVLHDTVVKTVAFP